jgi:hypothetical protein
MSEEQGKTPTPVNPTLLRFVQGALIIITVFLLVAHVLKWSVVQVDSITLALVGMLLIIPLVDLVRKIKLGEFEAEIGKAEVSKAQAKLSVELPPPTKDEKDLSEEQMRDLLQSDPRLAMAKIRIELEEALKRLYSAAVDSGQDIRRTSLGRLADTLAKKEVLSAPVASSVRDVITLANRAVHGEHIEQETAEELAMLGIRLVREVQQSYMDYILKPADKAVIAPHELDQYRSARYKVTTIIPYVENPVRNVYFFTQDALESFLEGYEEYAEFIVSVEQM